MTTKAAGYLIIYGGFLMVIGLFGYWSNPEKAKTALMSGGTFGVLSILWGVLGARGLRWSRWAAIVSTSFLAVVFAWRAGVGWLSILHGNSEKLFAASLITMMLAGSLMMLPCLLRGGEVNQRSRPE